MQDTPPDNTKKYWRPHGWISKQKMQSRVNGFMHTDQSKMGKREAKLLTAGGHHRILKPVPLPSASPQQCRLQITKTKKLQLEVSTPRGGRDPRHDHVRN